MNLDANKNIEIIEKYVDGKMSSAEVVDFEQKLIHDSELKNRVQTQKALKLMIIEAGLTDLKNVIKNDPRFSKAPQKSSNIGFITGGLLALISIVIIGHNFNSSTDKKVTTKSDKINTTNLVKNSLVITNVNDTNKVNNSNLAITPISNRGNTKNYAVIIIPEKEHNENNNVSALIETTNQTEDLKLDQKTIINDSVVSTAIKSENKCDLFKPELDFLTKPCLVNTITGEINCVQKTDEELLFNLNGQENNTGNFQDLESGIYTIKVTNNHGCIFEKKNIVLKSTYCDQQLNTTFNIINQEQYQIPILQGQFTDVMIYNSSMTPVMSFLNVSEAFWNGHSNSGNIVPMGVYKIEIKYKNGEICFVTLTVFTN